VIAKEKGVLVDSLQKQEDRDAQGRFLKGRSGNPEGRFRKGRSGNPKGRPAGARNKATQTAELLLDGEAEALTRRAVELALAGDGMALRLCLDRIIPPRRGRPVQLGLLPVRGAADLGGTMAITNAAADGTKLSCCRLRGYLKSLSGRKQPTGIVHPHERLAVLSGYMEGALIFYVYGCAELVLPNADMASSIQRRSVRRSLRKLSDSARSST